MIIFYEHGYRISLTLYRSVGGELTKVARNGIDDDRCIDALCNILCRYIIRLCSYSPVILWYHVILPWYHVILPALIHWVAGMDLDIKLRAVSHVCRTSSCPFGTCRRRKLPAMEIPVTCGQRFQQWVLLQLNNWRSEQVSCVSLSELIQLGVSINGGTPIAGWFIVYSDYRGKSY